MLFGQQFEFHDLFIIGVLIVLEGVLSIDNALVLGLLAKRLPQDQQKRALTYGLVGAFLFRFVAIAAATFLLHWTWVKLIGGLYLIWISIKHFFLENKDGEDTPITTPGESALPSGADRILGKMTPRFWPTVFVIEMTDIAFAVDSIVAAIGVVGRAPEGAARHPKLWVIITGGFLGVVVMRYAAVIFIRLLERFPRFETAAYLLVIVIGGKLITEWAYNPPEGPERFDFHHPTSAAFWVFWILMIVSFCVGFIPQQKKPAIEGPPGH